MYCKVDDLYKAIRKDFLESFSTENGDEDRENAIKQATAEINGYISARYRVPLNPIPDAITNICIDISIYKIICRCGIDEDKPEGIWIKRYLQAIKFLEAIRDGKNDIGAIENGELSSGVNRAPSFQSSESLFNNEFWVGFR